MSVRMGLRPLLVCSALFVFAQLAPAQVKVAVIDLQRAVFESAEIKKADEQMQATFKPRQDEIDQLQKEIAALGAAVAVLQRQTLPAAEADCRRRDSASSAICSASRTICRPMRTATATTSCRKARKR